MTLPEENRAKLPRSKVVATEVDSALVFSLMHVGNVDVSEVYAVSVSGTGTLMAGADRETRMRNVTGVPPIRLKKCKPVPIGVAYTDRSSLYR
jgi:hypothetical protein